MKKFLSKALLFLTLLFFPHQILFSPLHAQGFFEAVAERFARSTIQNFVRYAVNGERYPLLHAVSELRFKVLSFYINRIQKPSDTKFCSDRRNWGKVVPKDQEKFCQEYDRIIDQSKAGLVEAIALRRVYLKYEDFLLQEVQTRRATSKVGEWIDRKIRCLNETTWCGRNERMILRRVTNNDPEILQVYKNLLSSFKNKLFPELQDSLALFREKPQALCTLSGVQSSLQGAFGMVKLPGGTFQMGGEKRTQEKPIHTVTLDPFWIDQCEVTNTQYLYFVTQDAFLRQTRFPNKYHDGLYLSHWVDDFTVPPGMGNKPVVYVSWYAARYYCQANGKRLLSEAEWEWATRGLKDDMEYGFGNEVSLLGQYAWYKQNSNQQSQAIGRKEPNRWQIYDLHGNVWEWVYDWYADYPKTPQNNPQGPLVGKYKILRGGSWKASPVHLTNSFRLDEIPQRTRSDVGFRCASNTRPTS